jgi:beta-galactosidase GanA
MSVLGLPRHPHLQQYGNTKQLIVKGKPFLMLGAELQNSSLSSAEYMSEIWPQMVAANVNTLLGAVTWEMIEPVEGEFDFAELDKVIEGARKFDMHLVLLWFGSFKNGA